jgi:hypothetical protein
VRAEQSTTQKVCAGATEKNVSAEWQPLCVCLSLAGMLDLQMCLLTVPRSHNNVGVISRPASGLCRLTALEQLAL